MAVYTGEGGVGPQGSFLQDFETSFSESISATAEEAWRGSYWKTYQQAAEVAKLNAEGPGLSREEAAARIKASGVPGLEPMDGASERGLQILIDRKWAEVRTADTLSRARAGAVGEQSVARFVASLGVGLADPVNLAASFFPAAWAFRGVGLMRAAAAVDAMGVAAKAAPTVGRRLAAAAGVGAVEGAVGTIALEPSYYAARSYLQDDYGMADSLANVVMGGVFGGGLHAGIRGVGEVRRWIGSRGEHVADVPHLTDAVGAETGASGPAGGGVDRGDRGAPDLPAGSRRDPAAMGAATSVRFGPDLVESAHYAVYEASDLQALTDKSDAQYRDRSRAAYQAELQQRANGLDFEFLHSFAGADHGAPVLTAGGGPIVAGNGRTMLVQRAYEIGTGEDRYKGPLVARAAEFGLNPRQVAAMKAPVLVRVLDRRVDVKRAAQLSNEGGATPMSALELAKVDAERLGNLSGIEVTESGSLRTAGNRGLMRRWLEQQPENQRNALVDRDGYLSAAGLRRVQNAILFRAYGDTPMLARLVESADPGARNVVAGLTRAAAVVAEARAAAARGELHGVDLVPDLEAAVETFADLRDRGVNVQDWLANGELVAGISPEARALVAWFDEHARSPRAIADVVEGFYRQLERRGGPGQGDMFGGTGAPTVGELLGAAIAEARAIAPAAADLVAAADPIQREAAARAAVVQGVQGKAVDVAPIINGTPDDVVTAADRSTHPEATLMADERAAAAIPVRPLDAPPSATLEDARAGATEAIAEAKRTLAAGANAWKYARYWHGTPASKFPAEEGAPLGKFRWRFMGSGEGAQAFGYGHYVASREQLARERYRDRLIRKDRDVTVTMWFAPFAFPDAQKIDPAWLVEAWESDMLHTIFPPFYAGDAATFLGESANPEASSAALASAMGYLDRALRKNALQDKAQVLADAIALWREDSGGAHPEGMVERTALMVGAKAMLSEPVGPRSGGRAWTTPAGHVIGTAQFGEHAEAFYRALASIEFTSPTFAWTSLTAQLERDKAKLAKDPEDPHGYREHVARNQATLSALAELTEPVPFERIDLTAEVRAQGFAGAPDYVKAIWVRENEDFADLSIYDAVEQIGLDEALAVLAPTPASKRLIKRKALEVEETEKDGRFQLRDQKNNAVSSFKTLAEAKAAGDEQFAQLAGRRRRAGLSQFSPPESGTRVFAEDGEAPLPDDHVASLRDWLEQNDAKRTRREITQADVGNNARMAQVMRGRTRVRVEHPGSVYAVEIPDEVHDQMARWDDLVGDDEQPTVVSEAMRALMPKRLAEELGELSTPDALQLDAWRFLTLGLADGADEMMARVDRVLQRMIDRSVEHAGRFGVGDAPPFVHAIPLKGRAAIVDVMGRQTEFGVPAGDMYRIHRWVDETKMGPAIEAAEREVRAELAAKRAEIDAQVEAGGGSLADKRDRRLKLYREDLQESALDDHYDAAAARVREDAAAFIGGDPTFEHWYRWFAGKLSTGAVHEVLEERIRAAAVELEQRRQLEAGTYLDPDDFDRNTEEVLSVMLHQLGVPGHLFADGITRAHSDRKTYNAVLYSDDVGHLVDRYARAGSGSGLGTPAERLVGEVTRAFGKEGAALLAAGRVIVVDDVKGLPGGGHPDDVLAATAPDGTVYLVASNVVPEQVRGLVLHEVGVHAGLEAMVGADAFRGILGEVERLLGKGDEAVALARSRVPADTPADLVLEETLGYLVMDRPELPLVKRLLAAVKAWVAEHFPGLARRFRLNAEDLTALALSATRREARNAAEQAQAAAVGAPADRAGGGEPGTPSLAYARDPAGPRSVEEELRALDRLVERAKEYRSVLQSAAGVAEDRRPEVMRAVKPDLTGEEVQILLDELKRANLKVRGSLRSLRDALGAEDSAALMQDDALKAANEAANNLEMSAVIRQRQEALNIAARSRGLSFVMSQFDRGGSGRARGKSLHEGFMAMLGGTEVKASGSRMSVALEQQQFQAKWAMGLVHDIEKAGLWDLFMSDALALDTAKALEAFGTAKTTEGIDKRAVALAKIVRKYQEDARVTRNRFGAWIRELRGYITMQNHDQDKIYAAGAPTWTQFVAARLDAERTFGRKGMSPREIAEALTQLWNDFASGNHVKFQPDQDPAHMGVASLARAESVSRELYFKDATAFWEYHTTFGSGGFAGSIANQLLGAGHAAGLLKVLGTNPEHSLTRMMDEVSDSLSLDPLARRAFDSRKQRVLDLLAHVDGSTNVPGLKMGAQVFAIARGMQSIAKLGGAVVSSVTDIPVYGQAVKTAGGGLFSGMGRAIGSLLEGRSSQERKDVLSALGVYFDSMMGGVHARFDADGRYPGWMTRAMQAYFKFNLLTPWTERLRTSAALTFSHMLGESRGRAWSAVDADLRARLEAVRIDEGKWNIVRLASRAEADGRLYLTPEGIKDVPRAALENYLTVIGRQATPTAIANLREDLSAQLRAFFIDMAHHAVIEPDVRVRHWMLRGTQGGTVPGELLRMIGQFKAFPVAMARMVLGREIQGRGYDGLWDMLRRGRGDLLGIVELMVVMAAFGYGAMTAKDLLKGRKPRPPDSVGTWMAAFAQGGGFGIYGDFLFGEMRNRYGGGLTDTLAGPVVGTAADIADLWGRVKAGDNAAAAALRLAVNQTPFINVFYLRFMLDYLVLYRMQEAVNPGYLRRMEGRIRKENEQEFWLRPSEVVR